MLPTPPNTPAPATRPDAWPAAVDAPPAPRTPPPAAFAARHPALADEQPTELALVTWTDSRGRSWVGPAGCLNTLDPRPPVEAVPPAPMEAAAGGQPQPAPVRQIQPARGVPGWVRPTRLALYGMAALLAVAFAAFGGWALVTHPAPSAQAAAASAPAETPTALVEAVAPQEGTGAPQPATAVPPQAPPPPSPAPTPTADPVIGHTHLLVQPGDTVATLAARAGVDPAAITAALDGRSTVYAGEWVVLPVTQEAPPVIPPTVPPAIIPAQRPAIASGASFGAPGPPLPTATAVPPTLDQVVGEILGVVALPTPVDLAVPPTEYPHYNAPAITSGGSFGP